MDIAGQHDSVADAVSGCESLRGENAAAGLGLLKLRLPEPATLEDGKRMFSELVVEDVWEKTFGLFRFWPWHVFFVLQDFARQALSEGEQ